MDIRKDQFSTEAVRLLQDIADSHFIAFDFEFLGIAERNRNGASKTTVQERYKETRGSVQEYQPLQIGLTIVKFDEKRCKFGIWLATPRCSFSHVLRTWWKADYM